MGHHLEVRTNLSGILARRAGISDRPASMIDQVHAFIARRVKEVREDAGWTQPQVASKTGVAVPTISRYENGALPPSLDYLLRLADCLEVPVTTFFESPSGRKLPSSASKPAVSYHASGPEMERIVTLVEQLPAQFRKIFPDMLANMLKLPPQVLRTLPPVVAGMVAAYQASTTSSRAKNDQD